MSEKLEDYCIWTPPAADIGWDDEWYTGCHHNAASSGPMEVCFKCDRPVLIRARGVITARGQVRKVPVVGEIR